MTSVRKKIPVRTFDSKYATYRQYKEPLRNDFNKRCGYCDDVDHHCNGQKGYHIDHFRPKSSFPDLETEYGNLVYSCPYCNSGKGADWPAGDSQETYVDSKGYVDPCLEEYDEHFERRVDGSIKPLSNLGHYMFEKLNLGLRRHQLIHVQGELKELLNQIHAVLEKNKDSALLNKHFEVTTEYLRLEEQLIETL